MLSAFFYMDYWYVVLVIPAMILSLIVQFKMRSTYNKYSGIAARSGLTGADMARKVLRDNGVNGVDVVPVSGELTDHYDPKARVIRLSSSVYGSNSIAALGVAAHEAGHAVQHSVAYAPLRIRNNMVPVVNFASSISWWVFIIGLFADMPAFLYGGIILFSLATLFHLITLPVELNASRRAVIALTNTGALNDQEIQGTRKVLSAAAMTYLAALIASAASLLRMVLIAQGRRRD